MVKNKNLTSFVKHNFLVFFFILFVDIHFSIQDSIGHWLKVVQPPETYWRAKDSGYSTLLGFCEPPPSCI